LTLIGDVLKGALPVYLACKLTGVDVWVSLAALAAFLGHLFPVYLKFSGGKGLPQPWECFWFWHPWH